MIGSLFDAAPPSAPPAPSPLDAARDCPLCPRLVALRLEQRARRPDAWNAPVPAFRASEGLAGTRLLIVGLAPGVNGANRTGRPFTGDYAGALLYQTLLLLGLAEGAFAARPDDGLRLRGVHITNAVRCVPPGNAPTPAEVNSCNRFLEGELAALPELRAIVALGLTAHKAVLKTLGLKASRYVFAHAAAHALPPIAGRPLTLIDSYHCSRLNTSTKRLTTPMFEAMMATAAKAAGLPAASHP